jgi:hypothetical protein
MLISHTHRFAFVHVPKTGGCSIRRALSRHGDRVMGYWMNRWLDRIGIHVNHVAPYRQKRFRMHTAAETLRRQVPAHVFDGLFKFAFVRNPWDLLVSHYLFVGSTPRHHRHRRVAGLGSFEHYVDWELRRGKISQSRMLCDRHGALLVDYVGRFESLHRDFADVCRRLGLETTLPHVNRTSVRDRADWRTYYSPALAARVAEHFAEDIERFGYRFEAGHRQAA